MPTPTLQRIARTTTNNKTLNSEIETWLAMTANRSPSFTYE